MIDAAIRVPSDSSNPRTSGGSNRDGFWLSRQRTPSRASSNTNGTATLQPFPLDPKDHGAADIRFEYVCTVRQELVQQSAHSFLTIGGRGDAGDEAEEAVIELEKSGRGLQATLILISQGVPLGPAEDCKHEREQRERGRDEGECDVPLWQPLHESREEVHEGRVSPIPDDPVEPVAREEEREGLRDSACPTGNAQWTGHAVTLVSLAEAVLGTCCRMTRLELGV